MTRAESPIVGVFIERWGFRVRQDATAREKLERLEKAYAIRFPGEFAELTEAAYALYCPHILHYIVDNRLTIHDLRTFLPLEDIEETTAYAVARGLFPGSIVFATGGSGDSFCFRREELARGEAAVYVFGRDGATVRVAESFGELIVRYAAM